MAKRLFTDEELREMSTDWTTLALEALDAGDVEKARHYIEMADMTKATIHDGETELCADLMTAIYRSYGLDEFLRIMNDAMYPPMKAYFDTIETMFSDADPEEALKAWVRQYAEWTWKNHCGHFTIEEDDEKFIFKLGPCGSGGKLMDKGFYDGENPRFARVEEAGYWNYNQANAPIYCCHDGVCAKIMYELGEGESVLFSNNPDAPCPMKAGEPCYQFVYKDRTKFPSSVGEMLK